MNARLFSSLARPVAVSSFSVFFFSLFLFPLLLLLLRRFFPARQAGHFAERFLRFSHGCDTRSDRATAIPPPLSLPLPLLAPDTIKRQV